MKAIARTLLSARPLLVAAGTLLFGAGLWLAAGPGLASEQTEDKRATRGAATEDESIEVQLCDGETRIAVPAAAAQTREDGERIASRLMEEWLAKNPDARWELEVRERHTIRPPADNTEVLAEGTQGEGNTYRNITERDLLVWRRETERFVAEGARVFHSADELGSTIAVSCDMCHPDASNTHPETYPKFQQQLGRVALLRDMINWCIEHPVRGTRLEPDGPRMRALEAYILAQRTGTPLEYGKH